MSPVAIIYSWSIPPKSRSSAFKCSRAKSLEEERRLCYVAFTRAKKRLFLTHNFGYSHILRFENKPSRFIEEAGFKPKTKSYQNVSSYEDRYPSKYNSSDTSGYIPDVIYESGPTNVSDWKIGDYIRHQHFGDGQVIAVQKLSGSIDINFSMVGVKRISSTFKGLTKIDMGDFSWAILIVFTNYDYY